MAEYPTRSCGPCPNLAQFGNVKDRKDYITQNTDPKPVVQFKEGSNLNEHNLGVPNYNVQNPDLKVSPIGDQQGENYTGGIPPCKEALQAKNCPESCLNQEPAKAKSEIRIDCVIPENLKQGNGNGNGNGNGAPKKGILKQAASRQEVVASKQGCCCSGRVQQVEPNQQLAPPSATPGTPAPFAMHATAGRTPPGPSQLDEATPPTHEIPPCYLPQPGDQLLHEQVNEMTATGPWATGKLDWGPLAGLTGTRPVVDRYSIARYSEGEWRGHNKDVLDNSELEQHKANLVDWNGRQCLEQTQSDVDKNQEDNTKRLNQREMEILRWKCELERAIGASAEEISFMEEQRRRLKQAAAVLQMPESIAGECLERRTGRMDAELVRDDVEEELIREVSLCSEIRDIFARTLKDVEKQLEEDKTAKRKLEYDWSDKKDALDIDALNASLNTRSTILMFKPGAVIFPDNQSTPEYWEHFTKETLLEGEATRQRSAALRGTLDAILMNAARDLRTQADKVEMALSKRIACTEEVTRRLESDLKKILRRLADVEDLINDLRAAIRRMDIPMKKAQTRLDNRLQRQRVENCRDAPHFGLVEEVKSIAENVAALQAQLRQAEMSQDKLIQTRNELEREIMLKRKTLEIDRDRNQRIRSHYPSATALSGYA